MSGEIIAFFASRERDPVRAGVALDHLRGELVGFQSSLMAALEASPISRSTPIGPKQRLSIWISAWLFLRSRPNSSTPSPSQNISFPTRLKA